MPEPPENPRSTPDSNGRQPATGRFAPGNHFGKGNPQHKRMAELRQAALDATTPEMVRAIMRKLAVAAMKDGDVAAARLVLEYAMGKPTQAIELSGPDGEPFALGWAAVRSAILDALRPFGEARVAVALRLRELTSEGDDADQPAA